MKNSEIMRAWLEEAVGRLTEAREQKERGHYHRTVRLCQESSEFALKALLMFCGVDVPDEHFLHQLVSKQPLVQQLPKDEQRRLARSSRELADERLPSFYGSPDGTPPQRLYTAPQADHALEEAEFVLATVQRLVGDVETPSD